MRRAETAESALAQSKGDDRRDKFSLGRILRHGDYYEDSSHLAHVCADGFECDRQQWRREAGQLYNKLVLLRRLSSNLSLNSQA